MAIKPGDKIPEATIKRLTQDGLTDIKTTDIFEGRKVVIFGMPGSFMPTCAKEHLPDMINRSNDIRQKGVDEVIAVVVNDPFVVKQWERISGAEGKVTLYSDWNGDFLKAMQLGMDGSSAGLGYCAQRFAMIVDNGQVTDLEVEKSPGSYRATKAETLLEKL